MSTRLLGFPVSFLASLALTGGLFWLLHTRIDQPVKVVHTASPIRIDFTPAVHDTEVRSLRDEKPILEPRPVVPAVAHVSVSGGGGGAQIFVDIPAAPAARVQPRPVTPTRLGAAIESDVAPVVRIEPEYPARAAQHGIEGWVVVQFTVTPIGTVRDAVAVDSSPKGVFEDAAVRAVLRWKYNPRVERGTAVERRGIHVRLLFQLDED